MLKVLGFLLVFTVNAEVTDNQNILKKTDDFLVKKSFEEALICGDEVTFKTNPCGQLPCVLGTTRVTQCTSESIILESDHRGNISKNMVTKKDYIKNRGNMLRFFIMNLTNGLNKFEIRNYQELKRIYGGEVLDVARVDLTVFFCDENSRCYPSNVIYYLAKDLPFVAAAPEIYFNRSEEDEPNYLLMGIK